jgi:hypothetical protein
VVIDAVDIENAAVPAHRKLQWLALVERVRLSHSGQDQRVDGAAFMAGQRAALAAALARGLEAAKS